MKNVPAEFCFNCSDPNDIDCLIGALSITQVHAERTGKNTIQILKGKNHQPITVKFLPESMLIEDLEYKTTAGLGDIRCVIETLRFSDAITLGDYFCNSVYIRYSQFKRKVAGKEPIMWLHQ